MALRQRICFDDLFPMFDEELRSNPKPKPSSSSGTVFDKISSSNPKPKPKPSSSSGIVFDLDILDCHVCMEPLSPQIFQCSNGHSCVCQPCIAKMKEKVCPTCLEPIGKIRNFSLEKILESLKVPCLFADMGCDEMLQYAEKNLHEQKCPQRPHQCPIAKCSFNGPIKEFSLHFKKSHNTQTLNFQYDQWFSASIGTHEPYLLLHVEEDKLFIFHNMNKEEFCNVLYVTVFGSTQSDLQHNYSMAIVKDGENIVQLKSNVGQSSSSYAKGNSSINLLVDPRSFMKLDQKQHAQLRVELYICKPGQSSPSWSASNVCLEICEKNPHKR